MNKLLRVLMVEDSEDDTLLIVRELQRNGYDVTFERVETPESMTAALKKQTWDIITAGFSMPHFSSVEALKLLHQSGLDIPFIIISGTIGEDAAVESMKSGANDYLMKGSLRRLGPAVDRELREAEMRRERKQAEQELKASEERYRLLVENANEAIIVAQDGMLKFANPKAAELSGYSIKELTSMPFTDIIHPDDRDMVVDRYLRRMQGEVLPQIYPFRIIDKAGDIKWAEINSVSIIWEGKPATLNFLDDITERKKTEQQALVNAKLASVGELVSGVAHEINNPLTGVIGYAQLLADRQDVPHDVKDDLQKIYEESQRTVRIVQNLLRFARQYKPEKNLVDINELLERTLELEAYKLSTGNIELSTKLAADIPLILADYNQLQQVILNIVTNAQQAMDETKRKGKITVVTDAVEDYARISIADNGPGIEQENITRIFDPFFTTKPEGSGSGLGLSVCHGIITEHEGNLYAESTPDKGTTFIIELPIAMGEQAVIKEGKATEKKSRPSQRKLAGKILIVEDEPAIRAVLTRNLSARGYQVQAVSNGNDALGKLANNIYDLLLFDLKMPGMSGRELYEAVKKKHPNSAKRVVFITGDVMTADTRDFLASTGRPYLIKPFDSKDIAGVIEKVLTGQNS
ncbi:MAG: response regulator [Dehalococcoidia bacterium]|nr:response regulator [Dehalococcoidia bacterium]